MRRFDLTSSEFRNFDRLSVKILEEDDLVIFSPPLGLDSLLTRRPLEEDRALLSFTTACSSSLREMVPFSSLLLSKLVAVVLFATADLDFLAFSMIKSSQES